MNNLTKFLIILVLVFVIDMIWIKSFAQKAYNVMIPNIQKSPMVLNMKYALLCYILIAMFIMLLNHKRFTDTEMFLAGFLTYGIYDLTCASVFTNWDVMFGFADMIWGGILFTVVNNLITRIIGLN